MFQLKRQIGQHKVYTYNMNKYNFREYLENLYETNDLEHIDRLSDDYQKFVLGEYNAI